MERITGRLPNGIAFVRSETGAEGTGAYTTQRRVPGMISRLAAYEDTGLEPEEITTEWIPISDQMPGDERLKCWVTIQNVNRKIPFVINLYWTYDHWQWANGTTLANRFEVLAWKKEKVPVPFYPEETKNEEGK